MTFRFAGSSRRVHQMAALVDGHPLQPPPQPIVGLGPPGLHQPRPADDALRPGRVGASVLHDGPKVGEVLPNLEKKQDICCSLERSPVITLHQV